MPKFRAWWWKYRNPLMVVIVVALVLSTAVGVARHDPLWRVALPFVTAIAWAFIWWRGKTTDSP